MVDLPKKKVGIVACSGEEMAEGTVTRLAALKVLEQLRPAETVTICLPLFLAGGQGDRAFAKFYPTIAIDGCDKRCAARATEMHSARPAATVVVTDVVKERGITKLEGARRLNEAGRSAVDATAENVAHLVDDLLGKRWDRQTGQFAVEAAPPEEQVEATCSCGSNIPVQKVAVNDKIVTLSALPLIFKQFHEAGKKPESAGRELLQTVKIYNPVPDDEESAYTAAIDREYRAYCEKQEGGQ